MANTQYQTISVAVEGSSILSNINTRQGNSVNGNYELTIRHQGLNQNSFIFGKDAVVVFDFANPTTSGEVNHGYSSQPNEIGSRSTLIKVTVYENASAFNAGRPSYYYVPQNPIGANGSGGGNVSSSEQGTGDLYLSFQTNVFSHQNAAVRLNGYTGPIPSLGNEMMIVPSIDLYDQLLVQKRNVTIMRVTDFDHNANGQIIGDGYDPGNGFFAAGAMNSYVEQKLRPPICFAKGSEIATQRGLVPVEDLIAGDMILTADHAYQPLRWIGQRDLSLYELNKRPNLRPIVIKAGALGTNLPSKDLRLSPQHRVVLRSKVALRMFGEHEIMVAAKHLVNDSSIFIDEESQGVSYFHLLFDRHEIIFSNGAATESLFAGPQALQSLSNPALQEVLTLFPQLNDDNYRPQAARLFVQGPRLRQLALRHSENRKALYAA